MNRVIWGLLPLLLSACALPGYDRYPKGSGVPVRDAAPPASRTPAEEPGRRPPAEPEIRPMEPAAPVTVQPLPEPEADAIFQRSPAVQSLLDRAVEYRRQGRLSDAAASLERAQRIAPRDAGVYRQLAEVRLAQGNPAQAEQTAQKALAYAAGQRELQAELWLLIARARAAQGDDAGASDAEDEARTYRRAADSWWR